MSVMRLRSLPLDLEVHIPGGTLRPNGTHVQNAINLGNSSILGDTMAECSAKRREGNGKAEGTVCAGW